MTGSVCLYESSRNAARDRLRGKPATGINYDRWQARLDTPANYLPPVAPPVELDVHLHEDLAGSVAVAKSIFSQDTSTERDPISSFDKNQREMMAVP
jgi:hypothetical protein